MSKKNSDLPFWQVKKLEEMTASEWESLCDGCGKCCLVKLEDADTQEIVDTDVSCKLLDLGNCRCSKYSTRHKYVPDCIKVTADNIETLSFMPPTCAYRLLHEGEDLPWWHPLVTGDPNSVHTAGVSALDRIISETEVEDADLEDHVVEWPQDPSPPKPWVRYGR
ncbi:YcgN family cysteine cluster protein [Kiloniella laminariae]|uniref:YcgN family cysteine cluster protein n=1 Tax=Kiloniella laminariae TaxID=454162 RepID=UPI000377BF86|nr:YcgN family cysteine cluster protein [Kiloniella laminariae]